MLLHGLAMETDSIDEAAADCTPDSSGEVADDSDNEKVVEDDRDSEEEFYPIGMQICDLKVRTRDIYFFGPIIVDDPDSMKGLEATLTDRKKRYADKVQTLLSVWEHVLVFITRSTQEQTDRLFKFIERHTLSLILQGDWPKLAQAVKTHLTVILQRCQVNLHKCNLTGSSLCRKLTSLVKDPWGNSTLGRILQSLPITDSEVVEYCNAEKGTVLIMRLEMLCENKCEDLAMLLAEACWRCLRLPGNRFLDNVQEGELDHIRDIYLALLFRFKRNHDIIAELKQMDLSEGLRLVQRNSEQPEGTLRVWKTRGKVAELAAHTVLASAMVQPVTEDTLLQALVHGWASIHGLKKSNKPQTLQNMVRRMIQTAASSQHIYIFSKVLVRMFGEQLKSLCIELYIRGLTTNMNEVEQLKIKNDRDKVREAEFRLADGFLQLADLVQDNVGVSRECVLTAFSLNPTQSCYDRIKAIAVACGKCPPPHNNGDEVVRDSEGNNNTSSSSNNLSNENEYTETETLDTVLENNTNDIPIDTGQQKDSDHFSQEVAGPPAKPASSSVCLLHPYFDPNSEGPLGELCPQCGEFTGIEASCQDKKERTLDALILIKGNTVTESLNYDVLSAPSQVLDTQALGLTPHLCDDLATVLSSPRYQMLSWVLDWAELSSICIKYLENGGEVRNANKELKFLNIDYSQFKDWPDEEEKDLYYGIEKGYEQCIELSETDEDYPYETYKSHTKNIHFDTDSSDSLLVRRRNTKSKKKNQKGSDSDYDCRSRKAVKRKKRCFNSLSDSETTTQDSRTDSIGSDGFQAERGGKRPKLRTSSKVQKKLLNKKLKSVSSVETQVSDDNSRECLTNVLANGETTSMYDQLNNGKLDQETLHSVMNSKNKLKDSSLLKSLRMYRPHNSKNPMNDEVPDNKLGEDLSVQDSDNKALLEKYAPLLSTINLNPRIVLKRTKSAPITMNVNDEINIMKTSNDFLNNKPYTLNSGKHFSTSDLLDSEVNGKVDILSEAVIRSDLLAKTVPGLNSLDMIGPIPSEATVQVVQLSGIHPTNNNTVPSSSALPSVSQAANSSQTSSASGSNENSISLSSEHQPKSDSSNNQTGRVLRSSGTQIQSVLGTTSTSHLSTVSSPSTSLLNSMVSQQNSYASTHAGSVPQNSLITQQITTSLTNSHSVSASSSKSHPSKSMSLSFNNAQTSHQSSHSSQASVSHLQPAMNVTSPVKQSAKTTSSTNTAVNTSTSHVIRSGSSQIHAFGSHVINISQPSQAASMPISAHIQRIGQPSGSVSPQFSTVSASPRFSVDDNDSSTSTEDRFKFVEGQAPSLVRYIFKDGRLYPAQENSQLDGGDSSTSSNVTLLHSYSVDQIPQFVAKSVPLKDKVPNDQENSRASSQTASLPKFQQAFGKTMYQNNTCNITTTNASQLQTTNSTIGTPETLNFPQSQAVGENISVSESSTQMCTVLSKAVQTNKETEVCSKSNNTSDILVNQQTRIKTSQNTFTSNVQVPGSANTAPIENQVHIIPSSPNSESSSSDRASGVVQSPPGVIFTCKVPASNSHLLQGKNVKLLKTSVTSEKLVSKQLKLDNDNRGKETVIRSGNMGALLAAALHKPSDASNTASNLNLESPVKNTNEAVISKQDVQSGSSGMTSVQRVSVSPSVQKNLRRQSVQPNVTARYNRPVLQVSSGSSQTQMSTPVVTIPLPLRTVQAVIANLNQHSTQTQIPPRTENRSENLISHSGIEPSVSSTTLEQLREFESVLEQVTNTSQMKERSTVQTQSHMESINQQILTQPSSSGSAGSEFTATSTDHSSSLFQSTSSNTVHDLHGERVSLTFISQSSSGANNTLIANANSKLTTGTQVVVVQSCSRPVTSPALSVTSQSSSSPAPPSTPGTSASKMSAKSNKPAKSKSTNKTTPTTTTLKVSTLPKPQQKPQEDEQTTQRIYAILDKYAEQLRNSPELKNKPAPRRRSNPPTNPSQTSKRKKSTQTKSKISSQQASCSSSGIEMSPGSEDVRTVGSEDSSNGVSQISQVLNSPQSRIDEPSTPTGGDVSSETSESVDSKDVRMQHRVVLTDGSQGQGRAVLVQDSVQSAVINVDGTKMLTGKQVVVGGAAGMPLTLSLPNVPPGVKQVIFPVPADGRPFVVTKVPKMYRVHQVTMPSGSPLLTTTASGTVLLRQMCVNKSGPGMKQMKLPVVGGISSQNLSGVSTQPSVVLPSGSHSFTFSQDSSVEQGESVGISLDNTILLNTSSASSISFLQQSVQDTSTSNTILTTSTFSSSVEESSPTMSFSQNNELTVACIKPDILSLCASNILPTVSLAQENQRSGEAACSNIDTTANLRCITLEEPDLEVDYSEDNHRNVSNVPSMIIPQSDNEKRWSQMISDDGKPVSSKEIEKDDFSKKKQEIPVLHSPLKPIIGLRIAANTPALLLSKQDQFQDEKDNMGKKKAVGVLQHNSDISSVSIKDKLKSSIQMKDSGLCDEESASSDSAGSGRVKSRPSGNLSGDEKGNLLPESSQDTVSPWPYSVSKLEQIGKSNSPTISLGRRNNDIDCSQTNSLILSQQPAYKRKINNVENTIFQMAFRRSDRLRGNSKERETIEQRNAALLERELRLQKSLSEECEDLGVDEPSTSDLFPEAELLLDPDPSSRDSQMELPRKAFPHDLDSSSTSDDDFRSRSPVRKVSQRRLSYHRLRSYHSPDLRKVFCQDKDSSCSPIIQSSKSNVSDNQKSCSSGTSTPVNGGSTASPLPDEMPLSCTSEDSKGAQVAQKSIDENCKNTETDVTSDSDSVCHSGPLRSITCDDSLMLIDEPKTSTFIPLPNQASTTPYTYSASRNNYRTQSQKQSLGHELSWDRMFNRVCRSKEDLDSDFSEAGRIGKRSDTTDEDQPSDGEVHSRNGITVGEEELKGDHKILARSTHKLKRCAVSLEKTIFHTKMARTTKQACSSDNASLCSSPPVPFCSKLIHHSEHEHLIYNRRSSLRGHVKKGCPCCNGSPEHLLNKKKKDLISQTLSKTENIVVHSSPSPSSSSSTSSSSSAPSPPSSTKKTQHSKSILKSHIIKKR